MSTASWAPAGGTLGPLRWWVAVVCGALAPVLVTPLGDLLPPWPRVILLAVLAVVAVVCGLPPTFRRAWADLRGERPDGGAVLLGAACVLGLVAALPLILLFGILDVLAAVGLATAAHLVAARLLAGMLRRLPGADASLPRAPGVLTHSPTLVDRADGVLPRLHLLAAAAAAVAGGAWAVVHGMVGVAGGTRTAVAVLLVTSPAAFLVARVVPTRAARDRGRELGILFGDVDLLRLGRVRSLVLDPLGLVTEPRPRLVGVHTVGRLQTTAALQAAASVAQGGAHPAHAALVSSARDRALPLRPAHLMGGDDIVRLADIKGTVVTIGDVTAFDRVPSDLLERDCTLFVGWAGVARAGFELVPVVRSGALAAWPDLLAMPVRPVFGAQDATALRHVGSAMEMRGDDLVPIPPSEWAGLVDRVHPERPVAVVGDHDLGDDPDVYVMRPGRPTTAEGPLPAAPTTIRLADGDFTSAVRALGLARKTARVTTQGLILLGVLQVLGVVAAATGLMSPTVAAVIGAGLPLLAALNAVRPRSFAREQTPTD